MRERAAHLRGLRRARGAAVILVLFAAVAIAAPALAPYDPAAQPDVVHAKNQPPSLAHPLGTDSYSRDVLSRVIYGARVSIGIAALSVLVALSVGIAVGGAAGYAGGTVDRWTMRVVDATLAIPRVVILLVIAAALGPLSTGLLAVVLGLTGWAGMSRLVRARVREVAALDFVMAARAIGVHPARILWRHVLPCIMPQVIVAATVGLASVIPIEAGLSFLGLGVPPPAPSWGNIIFEGYEQRMRSWWLIVFPALAIVATVYAANAIAEQFRPTAHLEP